MDVGVGERGSVGPSSSSSTTSRRRYDNLEANVCMYQCKGTPSRMSVQECGRGISGCRHPALLSGTQGETSTSSKRVAEGKETCRCMCVWVTTAVIDVVALDKKEGRVGVSLTNHINSGSVFQSGSRRTGNPSCVILTEDTGGVPS